MCFSLLFVWLVPTGMEDLSDEELFITQNVFRDTSLDYEHGFSGLESQLSKCVYLNFVIAMLCLRKLSYNCWALCV